MEWKELEKDNLPPDILTGDYEFEKQAPRDSEYRKIGSTITGIDILSAYVIHGVNVRYRKRQPKAPTHEELAEIYLDNKVGPIGYNNLSEAIGDHIDEISRKGEYEIKWAYIAGRESMLPPEEPND